MDRRSCETTRSKHTVQCAHVPSVVWFMNSLQPNQLKAYPRLPSDPSSSHTSAAASAMFTNNNLPQQMNNSGRPSIGAAPTSGTMLNRVGPNAAPVAGGGGPSLLGNRFPAAAAGSPMITPANSMMAQIMMNNNRVMGMQQQPFNNMLRPQWPGSDNLLVSVHLVPPPADASDKKNKKSKSFYDALIPIKTSVRKPALPFMQQGMATVSNPTISTTVAAWACQLMLDNPEWLGAVVLPVYSTIMEMQKDDEKNFKYRFQIMFGGSGGGLNIGGANPAATNPQPFEICMTINDDDADKKEVVEVDQDEKKTKKKASKSDVAPPIIAVHINVGVYVTLASPLNEGSESPVVPPEPAAKNGKKAAADPDGEESIKKKKKKVSAPEGGSIETLLSNAGKVNPTDTLWDHLQAVMFQHQQAAMVQSTPKPPSTEKQHLSIYMRPQPVLVQRLTSMVPTHSNVVNLQAWTDAPLHPKQFIRISSTPLQLTAQQQAQQQLFLQQQRQLQIQQQLYQENLIQQQQLHQKQMALQQQQQFQQNLAMPSMASGPAAAPAAPKQAKKKDAEAKPKAKAAAKKKDAPSSSGETTAVAPATTTAEIIKKAAAASAQALQEESIKPVPKKKAAAASKADKEEQPKGTKAAKPKAAGATATSKTKKQEKKPTKDDGDEDDNDGENMSPRSSIIKRAAMAVVALEAATSSDKKRKSEAKSDETSSKAEEKKSPAKKRKTEPVSKPSEKIKDKSKKEENDTKESPKQPVKATDAESKKLTTKNEKKPAKESTAKEVKSAKGAPSPKTRSTSVTASKTRSVREKETKKSKK
jgi:hypothetical protein